jgi:hypothetical protein
MQTTDQTQSFTAQLFVNDQPVASARKVLSKLLENPHLAEVTHQLLLDLRGEEPQELSYAEGVTGEIFYFHSHDDAYTLRIKGVDGFFNKTASMEGSPRNLSIFSGDDPTYFRIINSAGEVVKLNEISDIEEIYLHTGPQQRPVKTYGEEPTFPVLTDDPNRTANPLLFKLKIIQRNPQDINWV